MGVRRSMLAARPYRPSAARAPLLTPDQLYRGGGGCRGRRRPGRPPHGRRDRTVPPTRDTPHPSLARETARLYLPTVSTPTHPARETARLCPPPFRTCASGARCAGHTAALGQQGASPPYPCATSRSPGPLGFQGMRHLSRRGKRRAAASTPFRNPKDFTRRVKRRVPVLFRFECQAEQLPVVTSSHACTPHARQ